MSSIAPNAAKNSIAESDRDAERADAQQRRVDDGGGVVQAAARDDRRAAPRRAPRRRACAGRPSPSRVPRRCRRRARRSRRRAGRRRRASGRAAFGSRASRSTRAPTMNAAMPTGTLTRKTQRQSTCDQQAADRRSGGGGDGADGRPAGDGDRALVRLELGQQQRERGRQHQRRAGRLDDAHGDERLDRPGRRAGGAGER